MKFLLFSCVMLASASWAVTDSDSLNLTATVLEVVDISVAPDAAASGLDLHTDQVDLKVAVVTESSNAENGYKIMAKSANAGQIKHATGSTFVAYTLKYNGGAPVTLTTSDVDIKTQGTGNVYSGELSDAEISYTGVAATSLLSGSYSDTITFTIESL